MAGATKKAKGGAKLKSKTKPKGGAKPKAAGSGKAKSTGPKAKAAKPSSNGAPAANGVADMDGAIATNGAPATNGVAAAAPVIPTAPVAPAASRVPSMSAAARAAVLLRMAADPTRLIVLATLSNGERNVGELCEVAGQAQPATSHHIAILRHAGIVTSQHRGKNKFYTLTGKGEGLARVVAAMLDEGGGDGAAGD